MSTIASLVSDTHCKGNSGQYQRKWV